ncbi:MAG TPA: SIS domain-containing protein, partial [Egibacteraceae bacterium]
HTLYKARSDYRGYLAVAVSQSGRTPEIVTVTERLRAAGAATVAVTNEADSPLAAAAEALVDLGAGEEQAVPATKTYTATVAAFAIIAEAFGECPWGEADWQRLPAAVAEVLDDDDRPERAAQVLADVPGTITVGRGFMFSTALEAALKLKETTSILAEGFSAADLRHGPIAVIEQEFPVIAFTAPGPAAADMAALIGEVRERGAHVLEAAVDRDVDLPLPDGLAEAFVPLPAVVRAQQVARALALLRGLDPDSPEGLRKVTPTT